MIETLHRLTDGKAYVASDVGQHQMFAALIKRFTVSVNLEVADKPT
ncbi:hypothetical protein [Symbiopectobacterium sp.]